MSALTAADFAAFAWEVHGVEPFPWQAALVETILAEGQWPDAIDVPTGLGKTSMLDVAVFVAAAHPEVGRRRVFLVVDRRLVVDEAHRHAQALQDALRAAPRDSVAARVADALRASGDDPSAILEVTRMRGGVTWDRVWLPRPDRYALVTGTVDQLGSRLLFRGYGVGEHGRSVDAALVGTDSLLLVDEAHLAQPFLQTITDALTFDAVSATEQVGRRPILVTLSATHGAAAERRVHGITDADREHPVAGQRLAAAKRLYPVLVKTTTKTRDTAMAQALAQLAAGLADTGVVGVVVNTVARARAVFDLVAASGLDAALLTGRSRPVDRDYLLHTFYPRVRAGRDRTETSKPLVLVATQTVEVGANIDLDALITESASWTALIQRLGRLNRLGLMTGDVRALVVHDSRVRDDDPVYGPARAATWNWLTTMTPEVTYNKTLDPLALTRGLGASPGALRLLPSLPAVEEAASYRPVLFASTLDAWVRTSPIPHPDPPIAPYLHGLTDADPPVSLAWRSELSELPTDTWGEALATLPPTAEETLDVPVAAVRRWLLAAQADDATTDQDATVGADRATEEPEPATPLEATRVRDRTGRPLVLRVRGRDETALIPATLIKPGDLLVVPTTYGGCDDFGWNPASTSPVLDVADLAHRRGAPLVRLGTTFSTAAHHCHPSIDDNPHLADALSAVCASQAEDVGEQVRRDCRMKLDAFAALLRDDAAERGEDLTEWAQLPLPRVLDALTRRTPRVTTPGATPWQTRVIVSVPRASVSDDDTAAGSSASAPGPVPLNVHQAEVGALAAEIASNLGLPAYMVAALRDAGRWHDEGKRDPRFQIMLHGGDHLRAEIAPAPLAKSGMDPADRAAFRRAHRLSGYPGGMRHEALSAAIAARYLARDHPDTPPEIADLIVHLIASHHGRSRGLLPPVTDPQPVKVQLDAHMAISTEHTIDWHGPRRFAALNQRHGRWGLALLETVLRLADIGCSIRDERTTP